MTLKEIVPDTSGFTASNGFSARLIDPVTDVGPALMVDGTRLVPHQVNCLREFFRHEEDERLGRMRVDGYPDWFVVWAYVGSAVYVCSDRMPAAGGVLVSRSEVDDRDTNEHDIARAFFDAHSEPKPWDDARFGEVWILTDEAGVQMPATFQAPGSWMFHGSMSSRFRDGLSITAGRKIWPEDAS